MMTILFGLSVYQYVIHVKISSNHVNFNGLAKVYRIIYPNFVLLHYYSNTLIL